MGVQELHFKPWSIEGGFLGDAEYPDPQGVEQVQCFPTRPWRCCVLRWNGGMV